ncbi:MORN repeat-containing protein 5-like [Diorhabda carinulata]|uniref:MORN repeat-containing protein 5-like n=1 Tax=Diorhabda carinulata TaxID=1163345 RepID=UPI0025A2B0BB|nr:MORN repeat-containing protein 5-like [Diorhabda carinulata]
MPSSIDFSKWQCTIPKTSIKVFGDLCHLPTLLPIIELPSHEVDRKNCTNSRYRGKVNDLGFTGYGRYVYPHGVIYEGYFKEGEFDGEGVLIYPKGQSVQGMWKKGKLVESIFRTSDGLEYDKNKPYLQIPDRTYRDEVRPDGTLRIRLPGEISTKKGKADIPEGAYDTGNGYFRDSTKLIYDLDHKAKSIVTDIDEKIIKRHFRKNSDVPVNFLPEIYEFWTSGRQTEYQKIVRIVETQKSYRRASKKHSLRSF